jgi:uncharacterized protein (DUF2147 family)
MSRRSNRLLSRIACAAAFIAAISFFVVGLGGPAFADGPYGVWMIENEVALEIFDCNGLLCGRIVYLRIPRDDTGELKREQENPRAGLRPRLMCGMTVLEDLRPAGPDNWDQGRFYDPRNGGRYSIAARLISRNVIVARIYSGSRVNGQSQTLLRVLPLKTVGWC